MTPQSRVERQAVETIRLERMLSPGDRVIVAVSGGPDSVALLSILESLRQYWNLSLLVVHFDHGLRGNESREDAKFVKDFCHRLGVEVAIKSLNLHELLGKKRGHSLQELAREARYGALFQMAEERAMTRIAIGHTADDQAETVLMWMIRGSGTGGLGGIKPVRHPYIIRPLLSITREEILDYLSVRELTYRVDTSNLKPLYFRNRIRQELIPILKSYNPKLVNTLARQADIVREDHGYLDQLAVDAFEDIKQHGASNLLILDRNSLLTLPLALRRRVIRYALQSFACMRNGPGFDAVETVLDQIVEGQSGSEVVLHGVRISREYDHVQFILENSGPSPSNRWSETGQALSIPSQTIWPLTGQTFTISFDAPFPERRMTSPFQVRLDAATFSQPLILRSWRSGDKFSPIGLGGKRKKLQDFFSDIKLERSKRETVPLLVAPEGILWVAGHRSDHRFQVTKSTQEVVTADLSQELC